MPSYPRFDANEHQDMAEYLRGLAADLRRRGELVDERFPPSGPDAAARHRWAALESDLHQVRAALQDVWERDMDARGAPYLGPAGSA